jgi:predicted Zn-dependent protease
MTRAVPFTQARIERAIKAARKAGARAVLKPDGTIEFREPNDNQEPEESLEEKREVVL